MQLLYFALIILFFSGCASQEKLREPVTQSNFSEATDLVDDGINPYQRDANGDSGVSLAFAKDKRTSAYEWASKLSEKSSERANDLFTQILKRELSPMQFKAELEKQDFHLETLTPFGKPLLHMLIERGVNIPKHTEYVSVLLESGAKIDWPTNDGITPLMHAVTFGSVEGVRVLLEAGANVNLSDERGWTALHYMADDERWTVTNSLITDRSNDAQISPLLIKAGANVNARDNEQETPLFIAIYHHRMDAFRLLIDAGAWVKVPNNKGWTPLISAVYAGNIPAVKVLISKGANINRTTKSGWTALHFTANAVQHGIRNNDLKLVDLLSSAGADMDAKNNGKDTPLHLAIANNRIDILSKLIESGADTETPGDQEPPIVTAILNGNLAATKALLLAGADPNIQISDGRAALHAVAQSSADNDSELAKLIISNGGNVNIQANNDGTPLWYAVARSRNGLLQTLIEAGANVNIAGMTVTTPLIQAVMTENPVAVEALIKAGANLDAKHIHGWTALHFISFGKGRNSHGVKLANLLINAGADVNSLSDDLSTPLMMMAANGRTEVARTLLNNGARTELVCKRGTTAKTEAFYMNNHEIVELIREVENRTKSGR